MVTFKAPEKPSLPEHSQRPHLCYHGSVICLTCLWGLLSTFRIISETFEKTGLGAPVPGKAVIHICRDLADVYKWVPEGLNFWWW